MLPIAGAFFAFPFSPDAARAGDYSGHCEGVAQVSVLSSPLAPWKGVPLRVIFAAEKPFEGELSLIGPNGNVAVQSHERHGGPPYFWLAEVPSPAEGSWQLKLVRDDDPAECKTIIRKIEVQGREPARPV